MRVEAEWCAYKQSTVNGKGSLGGAMRNNERVRKRIEALD